jgi:tellurite resistance protein TerC
VEPEHNPALRLVRKVFPVTPDFRGQHFFVRARPAGGGKARLYATPLFVVLVLVETTDLVFAVDSIPAVFGVTQDPFIVYTSNVFAILGLRALYFLLAGVIQKFHYLKIGLALVLAFVGAKMLLADVLPVPIGVSLAVIAGLLALSVVASLLFPKTAVATEPALPPHLRDVPDDGTAPMNFGDTGRVELPPRTGSGSGNAG